MHIYGVLLVMTHVDGLGQHNADQSASATPAVTRRPLRRSANTVPRRPQRRPTRLAAGGDDGLS